MSTVGIQGPGDGLRQLLRSFARTTDAQSSGKCGRNGDATDGGDSTDGTRETHRHHHHDHGGGKQLFKQIESAVTSALQSAQADGTTDPNQVVVQAIAKVLKDNGISLPASGTTPTANTPPTTDTQPATDTPPTTDPPPATDTQSTTGTSPTTDAQITTDLSSAASTQGATGSNASGSASNTSDPDGDGDNDGGRVEGGGRHGSGRHSGRQSFFQTLQSFGITPQQFRQDLLLALKAALTGSSGDNSASEVLPPGSAVDVTT